MKKFLTISLLIFAMFLFVSCGGEDESDDTGYNNNDNNSSENSGNNEDSGNNGENDNGIPSAQDDPGENNDSGNNSDDSGNNSDGNENTDDSGDNSDGNGGENGDTEPQCTPKCENKECGDDGCGGNCGSCNNGQGCSTTFKCEDLNVKECTGISINWDEFTFSSSLYAWYAGKDPELSMEFWGNTRTAPTVGTHDLGKGDNANYKTCTECVIIKADIKDDKFNKLYFQNSGTLKIDSYDTDSNAIKGSISATFVEATIANDATSTFVSGGSCIEIESGSFECVPQCDGRSCGPNGCGGSCGECDKQACSAEGKCVPYNCGTLSFDGQTTYIETNDQTGQQFYGVYTQNAGNTSLYDKLVMEFYGENSSGYFYPTDFADVKYIQITLYEDFYNATTETYTDNYKTFVNITLENFNNNIEYIQGTMKSKGSGSFRLEEVDRRYIPIAGGKCYDVNDFTWDTTAEE